MRTPRQCRVGRSTSAHRDAADRPIAARLNFGHEHVDKIDQSHERCVALGVSRIERPDLSTLGRSELAVVRERNLRLHDHAAPVMEMLYEQIVNTDSMVVLTDARGIVIHSIGDDDFLGRAAKVALAPGADWSEPAKGTNAVGTALVSETPTLVHADEHYLHANHFLTCSAAPILDPHGNILGVLDVSGDHHRYHQHTMALVKMSARMIENHWLADDYRDVMRLHFHRRVEFIGTLLEGILAVSADGRIVGANRGALEQLDLSGATLRRHSLAALFGTTVRALVDRFRSPLATPMPAQLTDGRTFHVLARFNWPVWTSLAEAIGSTAIGRSAPAGEAHAAAISAGAAMASTQDEPTLADTGLARLCTGDAQLAAVVDRVKRVLDRDIPVLILGETGTGKALLARAIHDDSARARQPFVVVHCASIPEPLIEAELFGREGGAFTGARHDDAAGKIVQAGGGTLFLDQIDDLPLGVQARLLLVLQERRVTPAGSTKSLAVDVSIICAAQRNLREMVDRKAFRDDLYYRLNGLAVRLPALRQRGDLMPLVRRILDRQSPQRKLELAADVVTLFERYHWPGNVRQLFNVLRSAALMAGDQKVIARQHLSDDFLEDTGTRTPGGGAIGTRARSGRSTRWPPPASLSPPTPASNRKLATDLASTPGSPTATDIASDSAMTRSLAALEIEAIGRAIEAAGGNLSAAARGLGISRNTIYRKLRWNAAC